MHPKFKHLLMKQFITKIPDEQILKQLVFGIRVFIPASADCTLYLNKDEITIELVPYKGFKGFLNRLFNQNKVTDSQQIKIEKLIKYWLSYIMQPKIDIRWINVSS